MKKLLILALVAIVAGAAFAETDPVFSGSFSTYWAYSFTDDDAVKDSDSPSMELDLGATIDDFNTVSVTVELSDDVLEWDDVDDDDNLDGLGDADGDAEITDGEFYLQMNSFTLKTDVTGAFGVDGPVGVTTEMGDYEFGVPNVGNVAPFYWDEAQGTGADGGIGLGISVDILDMVTLATVVYPKSYYNEEGEAGVTLEVTGIADMVDFAAYFISSEWDLTIAADGDPDDDEGINMGASAAITVMEGLQFGLTFNYDMTNQNADLEKGLAQFKFDVGVTMIDKLGLGLSWYTGDFVDFMPSSALLFSVTYDLLDNLGLFGAIGVSFASADDAIDFEEGRDIQYDCGITTALGALDVTLGASDNLDHKAPEDDFDDVLYVEFSTSF